MGHPSVVTQEMVREKSRAKAQVNYIAFAPGINPRPTLTSFSATCKAVLRTEHLRHGWKPCPPSRVGSHADSAPPLPCRERKTCFRELGGPESRACYRL